MRLFIGPLPFEVPRLIFVALFLGPASSRPRFPRRPHICPLLPWLCEGLSTEQSFHEAPWLPLHSPPSHSRLPARPSPGVIGLGCSLNRPSQRLSGDEARLGTMRKPQVCKPPRSWTLQTPPATRGAPLLPYRLAAHHSRRTRAGKSPASFQVITVP